MRAVLALTLLAAATPAYADGPDLLRTTPVRSVRSQLERVSDALALYQQLSTLTVEDVIVELGKRPEGAMLLAYINANQPRAFITEADATLGGGTAEGGLVGELTGAFTARVAGDFCDLASVGLVARGSAGTGDAEGSAFEARANAGVCLWKGLYFPPDLDIPGSGSLFPIRLWASLALNTTPRFAAVRNEPRRRYSEALVGFALEGIRYSPSNPATGVSFMYADVSERWEWRDAFEGDHGFETAARFGFFRLFRSRDARALADRAIDIIDIDLHGTRFDPKEAVALIDLYPVRISGFGLGSDRVLLDAEIGVTTSGGTISSTNCLDDDCTTEEIDTGENVADVVTWAAHGALSAGERRRALGLDFRRFLSSNILGQLTLENRTTLWHQVLAGPLLVRADAFAGTALHYLDVDARGREKFVGGTVDGRYNIGGSPLWVGVQLDAVAAFDRDDVLSGRVAGSGVRAFITLGVHHEISRQPIELPPIPDPFAAPAPDPETPPAAAQPVTDESTPADPYETPPVAP
jgi:hypothetical protein